jgi:hypothetical protein
MSVTEWSEKTGIRRDVIYGRIKTGWPVDLMLTTPNAPRGKKIKKSKALRDYNRVGLDVSS